MKFRNVGTQNALSIDFHDEDHDHDHDHEPSVIAKAVSDDINTMGLNWEIKPCEGP